MFLKTGQVWEQKNFPHFEITLLALPNRKFCRVVMENGNLQGVATDANGSGRWQYTKKEMERYLTHHGFSRQIPEGLTSEEFERIHETVEKIDEIWGTEPE